MWTKALWPRAAWSPRRLSMRPHALLVPQVLLEVSLDRKPTIGEFLDKARSLYTSLPRPLGSTRVHSRTPLLRRSNGTTRRRGLLARRLTAFYMCMSCLAFEPSTVSRRWEPLRAMGLWGDAETGGLTLGFVRSGRRGASRCAHDGVLVRANALASGSCVSCRCM